MKRQILLGATFLILVSCGGAQQMIQSTSAHDSVTDIDGNVYKTAKIGNQWWMAENLRVTHYRNGDKIPNLSGDEEWDNANGAYCCYNNDSANIAKYGMLYNWFAVADSRNIAPEGWHVPTDEEWQVLVDYLGGAALAGGKLKSKGTIEGDHGLWRGSNERAQMKAAFQHCQAVTATTMEHSMVWAATLTFGLRHRALVVTPGIATCIKVIQTSTATIAVGSRPAIVYVASPTLPSEPGHKKL